MTSMKNKTQASVVTKEKNRTKNQERVALVCSNFNMQSAFGLLILALNSARLGYETMIYFTFEGLHMIRPGHLKDLRYYPAGVDPSQSEVDRISEELRETMDRKDIAYPEDMLEMAQLEGVQYYACKTSADLFDLKQEDFIPGVQLLLAKDFMRQAVGSNLHMVF